ncbi:MAG: hypothetical protein M0001_06305 [Treponema sp.]|nr:hypothetical protein [Treponema sp.]
MKLPSYLVVFALVAASGPSLVAQSFSGSIEPRLGWYWGSSQLLPLTQDLVVGIDGKVGDKDMPTAQYKAGFDASYDPSTAATTAELGETWIKLFAGPFDISAGNQVLAWGSTDAFTPSDVVNPQDLSIPVDPVKKPVPLGRIVYNGDILTVDLVAEPYWVAPTLPGPRWTPASPLPATLDPISISWDNVSYGGHAKLSLDLLEGLDIGLTAYRGRSYTPTATVNFAGVYPSSISLDYDRLTLLGADAVFVPGGGFLLKTDWGYRTLRDSSIVAPEAGAASLQGVSGFEYRIGQLQLIGEYVLDWAKGTASAGDTVGHSLVGIASMDVGSRTSLKVAAIYDFKASGGMVAPQASYTLADGLQLNCDMFFFYGSTDGSSLLWKTWNGDSLGRVSLKYSF